MKKTILILTVIIAGLFAGCGPKKHEPLSHIKVHSYKQKSSVVDNNIANDWIFWYLILNNNGGCYYYQSITPVTNYSNIAWTTSKTVPEELGEKNPNVEDLGEEKVEVNELSPEMQTEIDTTPENFNGMTAEEMGDYEGTSSQPGDNSETSTDNSSTESSSSESSSSGDSGGGDSGGGDGGGGGD